MKSVPGRHRIDFEHQEPAVGGLDDIDPGIVGADASGGSHREIGKLVARDRGLGARALLDIGDPARPVSDHGGDDATPAHQEAPILMVPLRGRYELLEIIDPVDLLGRGEIGKRGNEPQAFALRSEERLLHQFVAFGDEGSSDRLGLGAIGKGKRAGRRQAGALEKEGRRRFVDAAFDGACVVPHRHAELAQGMQHAEIERDRLEAAARNEADEGALGQTIAETGDVKPGRRFGREAAKVERRDEGRDPVPLEGAGKAPPMPVAAIAEHDDGGVVGSLRAHGP